MRHLDPRIGTLNSGRFYAFVQGYDQPETVGTLEEVEIALGLRQVASPASTSYSRAKDTNREFIVTMTQGGEETETVERANSAAQAISKARRFWNDQEGRTRTVDLLPRHFRARLAASE